MENGNGMQSRTTGMGTYGSLLVLVWIGLLTNLDCNNGGETNDTGIKTNTMTTDTSKSIMSIAKDGYEWRTDTVGYFDSIDTDNNPFFLPPPHIPREPLP